MVDRDMFQKQKLWWHRCTNLKEKRTVALKGVDSVVCANKNQISSMVKSQTKRTSESSVFKQTVPCQQEITLDSKHLNATVFVVAYIH